jgi:hypothetical protein
MARLISYIKCSIVIYSMVRMAGHSTGFSSQHAWSSDIPQETDKRYTITRRATVAFSAVMRRKDPLLEIAKVGLGRHFDSLSQFKKETYALRFCKAAISRMAREAIGQALEQYANGDNVAAARTLWEGCMSIPNSSCRTFYTFWKNETGSVRNIDFSVESRFEIIRARGDAFRAMESASERRWNEILDLGPMRKQRLPDYESLKRMSDAVNAQPDGVILEKLQNRVSQWSCAD